MTSLLTQDPRFGLITGFGTPASAARIIALGGSSQKILLAQIVAGLPVLLGESVALGGTILAANGETSPNYHVLTSAGMVRVSSANSPAIVSTHPFNPGGGRWLALFSGFIATPLAKGGVQVLDATTGVSVATDLSNRQSSMYAASDAATGRLWVVDHLSATISTFVVSSSTGSLTFMGQVSAPSCRDVIKVVADVAGGYLFVVCRNRIVRFTIPSTSDTPIFAQDYGQTSIAYTDFLVLASNSYWVGQEATTAPSALDLYFGPMYGAWVAASSQISIATPMSAAWSVSDVVPSYTISTLPGG